MSKSKVAVIGTGPAGLVAAFALQNDLRRQFNVTVFEAHSSISLDGHSYQWVDPHCGRRARIDVPMRVFSGRYYQNLFYLLEYLGVPAIERRFLFAFADSFSRYYFFHWSNNHRFPRLCRVRPGVFGLLASLWNFFTVVCCYIWFSFACFWIPPKVQGPENSKTETMGEYLGRLRLPTFFIEDYMVPLFSSVSSSPHRLFLDFPAVYLTDYKRQTHMFPHKTSVSMTMLQDRLCEGLSFSYNSKVTLVEPFEGRLKLHYHDGNTGRDEEAIFNKVVLAINPRQISEIHPRSAYVMDKLQISEVRVVVHKDYSLLPAQSTDLARDNVSELIAMQIKLDSAGGKTTVATHAHPCGILSTVWPGDQNIVHIDEKKVLSESKFVRLLANSDSRDHLAEMFRDGSRSEKASIWKNGDDGIYIAGGWAWDGFALLEGCVWSGLKTARSIGAVLPFTPVERTWR